MPASSEYLMLGKPISCRHTWLLAPEEFEFGSPPLEMKGTGPLLRGGGFTAPMHMARRALGARRATSSLKLELSRHARVDDTCCRRPGDATAWRSAACARV